MGRTIYIHTLDGKPATFDGQQICFAHGGGMGNKPCYSLDEIREQQDKSHAWRKKQGFSDIKFTLSYKRYRVDD